MKYMLYSGGSRKKNHQINKRLLKMVKKPNNEIKIAYIPSDSQQLKKYFNEFKKYFKFYGVKKIKYLPLDNFKKNSLSDCDIVYIDGGNTYQLLEEIRSIPYFKKSLKEFSKNGGIISGQSAGVIVLTENISMASIPSETADENYLNTKKTKALNLLNFHFSPHYENDTSENKELKEFSYKTKNRIIAIPDGSAISINNKSLEFIGQYTIFENGQKKKTY